ncbi:Ankyrin repeat domain-containing protein 2A (AtAKR2) [Durusdinium trenchii]|uniref:Ankyrin repeat domain-containing protein 2A (AtAKR2) n=1 Tax=Durusdinium trenchii TaxID=1381693 RepID=A0ABP0RL73_9DINO
MPSAPIETLSISDGSALELRRLKELDDDTWTELKHFVERSPETAHSLQGVARNPEALQGWLQLHAVAEHYQMNAHRSQSFEHLLEGFESDETLGPIFQDLRMNGVKAVMSYSDEALMMKVSDQFRKQVLQWETSLQKLEGLPYPLHEAAKDGDHRLVLALLERCRASDVVDIDRPDSEGITALGYAVWAGHLNSTKLLIEQGADPYAVDSCGNSCVHYAAGYGHPELLEYLLEFGFSMHRRNAAGLTPMAVALQSQEMATIHVLETFGV